MAPALITPRAVSAAASGVAPYPASMSAVTGTRTLDAMRRTTASISPRLMRSPSA